MPENKNLFLDFPDGTVDKNPCQCRGHRFDPWSEKIPHATGQLSPYTIPAEPTSLKPVLCNERSHCNEKPAYHKKSSSAAPTPPGSLQLEKAFAQQQRPSAAK